MSMPLFQTVSIDLAERSYDIHIGSGLLCLDAMFDGLPRATSVLIVSNETVAPLYAAELQASLGKRYAKVLTLALPDGEVHKNWQTLNLIFDALLQNGCDRKTLLVALGGGVVGDMTGFAAASFMRGVPFVQLPTTLLAQVDSSVGGKTGINHPLGKNMVGAFYQPRRVLCDLDVLTTLPGRELSAGLAEVIKYGPIADMAFFEWLEHNVDSLMDKDPEHLAKAVARSCQIKAWVVGQDEREGGIRAILNFGHTFGHAIESALGFGVWLHGEAVGCGMVMGAKLSCLLKKITQADADRLTRIIHAMHLPVTAPKFGAERYIELMQVDKKAEGGQIRYVLLDQIGKAYIATAPHEAVIETLRATGAA